MRRHPTRPTRRIEWLRRTPWEGAPLPPEVTAAPTMLSIEEKQLLYVLARRARRAGRVGRAGRGRGRAERCIHTYDLFALDPSFPRDYPDLVADITGDSTRPRFEEVVGGLLEHVEVHEGDICEARWTGGPIDVLFVDVCKSWAINDHVVGEFFPALVPGRSVVIQQDLIHEWLPYLTITMGLFGDAFELIATVPWCSAVYVPTRTIRPEEIPRRLEALSPERKLEFFDRGCAPFAGEYRGVIECARAVLLVNVGRRSAAIAHLAAVRETHAGSERVQHVSGEVSRWVAAQADPTP